jgi:hypothetical protein
MENIEKGYTGRNICILSDSQAAIKALDSYPMNSKLVWDCHQSLVKLAEHNRIQLVWVLGHMGVDRNEIADQLTRQGSSHPLIGPEPALGKSAKVAREVIRDWTSRKREEHWQYIRGQGRAKGFFKKRSAKKPVNCSISAETSCHLKGQLFKLGPINSPECNRCKQASEIASHMLCD